MPQPDPRSAVARHAAKLLAELAALPVRVGPLRVADAAGGLACLVVVWPAAAKLPTAGGEFRKARGRGRDRCRADVLAAVIAAGRPVLRKEVVRILRDNCITHGAGTVAKALADLTAAGRLVNDQDHRGYRIPGTDAPGLFD